MTRIVSVTTYLTAAVAAVLLFNADSANGQMAMALLGLASLLLGWGTGQPIWALLAFLAVPFAVPFGFSNERLGSDVPQVWMFALYWAIGSAILIAISAAVRMIVKERQRAAAGR